MMTSEHIIKGGGKRIRHGSYKVVYLDNKGNGKRYWRAEYQTVNAGGVTRLRNWFKDKEDAFKWLRGR